jgi:hypothetical protein
VTSPPPARVETGSSAKTTWTARTTDQIVAALARKGWSRDSARDACNRAAGDGLATTTNKAGDLVAFVTFGNTEVDLWDAEVKPGGDAALQRGAEAALVPPRATPGKDGTADPAAGLVTSPAGRGQAEQTNVPAGRASAPRLASSNFPTDVQTGASIALPGPAPCRARQNPPTQAQGRRR